MPDLDSIPFSAIPHSSRLLVDYLYQFDRVSRFYGSNPYDGSTLRQAQAQRALDPERRALVADVLAEQNRGLGSDAAVEANLRRLREPGTVVVATGQQLGLFGGPAYSVYKALTAIHLAHQLTADGLSAVPLFWLASEDHDLEEVNHCTLLNRQGELTVLREDSAAGVNAPVGTVRFSDSIASLREAVQGLWPAGLQQEAESLLAGYVPGATYSEGFGRLWQRLFAGRGLILLDPLDPRLRLLAAPLFRRALLEAEALDRRLRSRARELRQAGYHVQVRQRENATLLFLLQNGSRLPLRRRRDGSLLAGEQLRSQQELLELLEAAPAQFSPNVLLRPVLQDWLLPTAAIVAGPNEIAYFAQASVLYEALLGWMPPIFPRASFTLVEPKVGRLLRKNRLEFDDLLGGRAHVGALLAERQLPANLQRRFAQAESKIRKLLGEVRDAVGAIDSTLEGATETSQRKILYQFSKIRRKAARAQAERAAIVDRHLNLLLNSLYPSAGPQERTLCFLTFLARAGPGLIDRLFEVTSVPCSDHQLIFL